MKLDEYLQVRVAELGFPEQRAYEQNLILVSNTLRSSPFLGGLGDFLAKIAGEYAPSKPSLLFGTIPQPIILHKPFSSVLEKTFRVNVLFNRGFPEEPKGGWINGENFYERLNDVVRSTIVCKYLDGPGFVCKKLKEYCDSLGIVSDYYAMNTDRGYYSWHFYATFSADVFVKGQVRRVDMKFELQVTTQLAEVMTALTHGIYGDERVMPGGRPDDSWKWMPETEKFRAAYLGHTLHLLEGVILGVKDGMLQRPSTDEERQ